MEPEDPCAEPLSHATGPAGPWWAAGRIRLGLLLLVLLALVPALLATRWSSFGFGGSSARARGAIFAPNCPGAGAPEAASVPAGELSALREGLAQIMPPRVGRLYESGLVATSDLWSDAQPLPTPPSSKSSTPAGYELRWWALDRNGSEDDIAADVFEFATAGQAQGALARAASPRCRRDGEARAAALPRGAEDLSWINPDKAAEWDVLFVRGRRLYRIVDVPSSYLLTAAGRSQEKLLRRRAAATGEALACALPGAGCVSSRSPVPESGLARLPLATAGHSDAAEIARAHARSYAQAVNLRSYDVPGMRRLAGEGATDPRGWDEAFIRCMGRSPSKDLAPAFHSPLFVHSARRVYQTVYSTVEVLASEAAADRYLGVLASARARACIVQGYSRWVPGAGPGSGRVRIGRIVATALPSVTPAGYRGLGPYRAMRLRLAVTASETTRRGRELRFPLYFESGAFIYGDVLVELSSESFLHPFPQDDEEYLTSALLGRAQASGADLASSSRG